MTTGEIEEIGDSMAGVVLEFVIESPSVLLARHVRKIEEQRAAARWARIAARWRGKCRESVVSAA